MLTDSEQNSRKSWNVQELLKYNNAKQVSPQILKNLEKAKQSELLKKPSIGDLDNEGDYKVYRHSFRTKPDFDNPKVEKNVPMSAKKELPQLAPLTHKPRNSDAFAATGQRLAKLETLCNNQREEIKSKSQIIEKLYNDANLSKKSYQEELSLVKDENQKLKDQVENLMKLLEKNNIAYTQEQNTPKADQVYEDLPEPSEVNSNSNSSPVNQTEVAMIDEPITNASPLRGKLAKEIDIKLVQKRIKDLNDLIAGEQDIVKDRDGAYKFKRRDPIIFCIYKDGIELEGFPFYRYSQKEAQRILEDILDGYFPAILREKFPEGIPFELESELDCTHQEAMVNKSAKKKGGEVNRSNHFATIQSEKTRGSSKKPRDLSVAAEREEDIEIATPSVKDMKEGTAQEDLTTLKIRTETGKRNIILKALVSDSIKIIYDLVHPHSETKNFEIWGGYPPHKYSGDDEASLHDLDISGESVFNLRGLLTTIQ